MTALPLAQIGLEQFRTRQAKAHEVVRQGKMAPAQAEAHLRPWAAIATLCGADLPELAGIFADIHECLHPAGRHGREADISTGGPTPPQADGMTRWIIAEEICPRARWVPMFAAARDAAMDRLHLDDSPEAIASAAALHRIAVALAYDINGHVIPPYDATKRIERARAAHPERKAA
jgi:hypothetical protein